MRLLKLLGMLAALALMISCFFPWVLIESKELVITGVDSKGTNFGKPGYLHLFFGLLYGLLFYSSQAWSRRTNLLVAAVNTAWAVRNFTLVSTCYGGECPLKQTALYVLLIASIVMLFAALFAPENLTKR